MAKLSMVLKNQNVKRMIELRRDKRRELVAILVNDNANVEEKFKAMKVLDKTSRSSYIRYRNRCAISGRPRGYRGGVGLSRQALRHYASFGLIVGVKKGS